MKKLLSVAFVLIFLLSLGSLDVHAQSAPTAIAYLPLLPAAGRNDPSLEVRQAYDRLLPQLMQARKAGQIVRFRADLGEDMAVVEYPLGTNLAALLGNSQPVFATPQTALAYTRAGALQMAQAAPAGTASFTIGINDSCFYGYNLGISTDTYKAYLYDSDARVVASVNGDLNASGGISDACFNGLFDGMAPYFEVVIFLYHSGQTTWFNEFPKVIPNLAVTSVSSATKTIGGVGPAGGTVFVNYYHYNLDSGNTSIQPGTSVTATSKGAWQAKFSATPMRGGDTVNISEISGSFNFTNYLYVPYIECGLDNDWCNLTGISGAVATLSFTHAKHTYSYSGLFGPDGYFMESLSDTHGMPVFLAVGDKVKGKGAASLTLPNITANPDDISDTVSGYAPANRWFLVQALVNNTDYNCWTQANSAGMYTANFTGKVSLPGDKPYPVYVYYTDPVTGDQIVYESYMVP
ncbi:MAG: hypothetical protein WCE68_00640 [Anaerolineales bacterium]